MRDTAFRLFFGTVTTAAAAGAGIKDSTILALGRWTSSAFVSYIRLPQQHLANLAVQLALAAQPSAKE